MKEDRNIIQFRDILIVILQEIVMIEKVQPVKYSFEEILLSHGIQ